jgi:glycosyltransferase involved in cell wall biosynthesis
MRIAFCWDWPPVLSQVSTWEDGLAAAIKHLGTKHEVQIFMPAKSYATTIEHPYFDIMTCESVTADVADFDPDVILIWGDTTRPNAAPLFKLGKPMALCFAGGNPLGETYPLFDHIFVESQVYKEVYDKEEVSCSIAFGTNTDLFRPVEQNKAFDTIFPATFAAWKRHSLYAQATQGLKSVAVGYMYDNHEQECWQECLRLGVTVLPHASAQVLHRLYAASKVCVVTSSSAGGSQRTVLEAMAMNLPLVVTDSDKYDYITDEVFRVEPEAEAIRGTVKALLDGERTTNTREHVLKNWSHICYADKLEEELLKLL